MSHQNFPKRGFCNSRTVRGQKKRRGGVGSFKRRGHLVLRGDDWLKRPQTRDLVAWERPRGPAAGCTQLRGACWGGAGVCGNAAQAQQFSAEPPAPLPPRSVSAAPLAQPGLRRPAARTMGQCGITSSKTVLVFLNLIFWVSWRAARAGGGLGAARGDQAGAGASRGVARALRPRSPWWGPSGAGRRPGRCRPEVWGGLRPAGTVPGYAGPRDASLRGALFSWLSLFLSGRQARNGTLPVSRVRCLCLSPRRASCCPQVM